MNFSRQALLGIGMIIGGSVMLYAMVQQIGTNDNSVTTPAIVDSSPVEQASIPPLTTDIDTEKRLLAQKQKERALRVAEQERRAQEFLVEQESAEAKALAKSRAENQQYVDNTASAAAARDNESDITQSEAVTPTPQPQGNQSQPTSASTTATASSTANDAQAKAQAQQQQAAAEAKKVEARKQQAEAQKKADTDAKQKAAAKQKSEQAAAQKAQEDRKEVTTEPPRSPTDYTVKSGDGLIKLARQYNVPVAALAQANNTSPSAALQLGQTLTIPSRKQIERLEREATASERTREDKRKQEQDLAKKSTDAKRDAQQKLREARREVKDTDAQGSFGVQVALANDQDRADEMVKRFQSAGYQAKTSATSRGVRVIVGPERGKVAALALKDKINSDPKVNTTSAWVLYWR